MYNIPVILRSFGINASEIKIERISTGHVNETLKIYSKDGLYILQKINTDIFRCPEKVMHNINIAQTLMKKGFLENGTDPSGRFPAYLYSGNKNYLTDNGFWRIYEYIESVDAPPTIESAGIFGSLLGEFHKYTDTADTSELYTTIDGFHDIEKNISAAVMCDGICGKTADYLSEVNEFYKRSKSCLSEKRLVHNDVKWANVLINPLSGLPEAIIDYDTVMEGYAAFDFGDAVRSACVTSDYKIDASMLKSLAEGYNSQYGRLCPEEQALGILAITTELSARYLHSCLSDKNGFPAMTVAERLERHENTLRLSQHIFENFSGIVSICRQTT